MTKRKAREGEPGDGTQFVETVSVKDVATQDVEKLLAQIADLREQLKVSEAGRTEAQAAALAAAEAQGALMQREIVEVATGRTVCVQRCKGYKTVGYRDGGRPQIEPVFHMVELPTYYYKIDMPPVGGTDLKLNDTPMYHGQVVEVDIDTLRTLKDMVFRLWKHDADIHGSDENFYRPQQKPSLSMKASR